MNHTEVIQIIAERSHTNILTCDKIIKSYEKYCEGNLTRSSEKHLAAIVDYISSETLIDEHVCVTVMGHYFQLIKGEIKMKLPFIR
ncbi:hypothetical protein [Enterococcus larvae]|uniref:hypothetical protein n=1 Tax=Enterococcus larvae TaxID=2794352 RepID=UPI003F3D1535